MTDDEAFEPEKPKHELIGFEIDRRGIIQTDYAVCSCGERHVIGRAVVMSIWAFAAFVAALIGVYVCLGLEIMRHAVQS